MDAYAISGTVTEFVESRPQLAGYIALMLALMFTGRIRLVISAALFGLVGLYAYHIGRACACGHLPLYHALIAALISAVVVVITLRYACR